MLNATAKEGAMSYVFTVTDGTQENTYVYEFDKQPPDEQAKTEYLTICKETSLGLAQWEISQKQPMKEIVI